MTEPCLTGGTLRCTQGRHSTAHPFTTAAVGRKRNVNDEQDDQRERATREPPEARPGEMAPLIRRLRRFLDAREDRVSTRPIPFDAAALSSRFGFSARKQERAEIILSEDVGMELGHPSTASRAVVLTTFDPECVRPGRITLLGPDMEGMTSDRRPPLGQAVILGLRDEAPDPFELDSAQYLTNRLPGFMIRSVPGRLWVRVSRKARAAGLNLAVVGSALAASYTGSFEGVEGMEVVFITSSREDVEELGRIAAEADILSGRHKKLVLGVDGEVECLELNCEVCEDKPVCDELRDIVIKRRGQRT